jgi:hypothetical protein
VASGLRLRILATGPAPIRLYSDHGRLREPDLKVCPGSSSGIDEIPRRRPGASRTELGRRRSIERQRDPRRRSSAELGDPLSGYRAPQGAALRRRDPRNRIRLPSGEGLQEHHVQERAYLLIAGREINISRDASSMTGGSWFALTLRSQRDSDGARAQRRAARGRARRARATVASHLVAARRIPS